MAARLIVASLFIMTLSSCAADQLGALPDKSLWRLTNLADFPPVVDAQVSLEINRTDAQLTGSTGCNRYSASFSGDFENPRVGAIGMTKRACISEKRREQERRFIQALRCTARIHTQGVDRLVVETDKGSLMFERIEMVDR